MDVKYLTLRVREERKNKEILEDEDWTNEIIMTKRRANKKKEVPKLEKRKGN